MDEPEPKGLGAGDPGPPDSSPRLIIVGNLTLDDVVLPDGTTRMAAVGGNTVYASLGARLWQPNIGIVTRRGEDFPPEHLATLHELGIATEGVADIAGPTVRNWVVYEEDGRRHWLYRTLPNRSLEVAVQPQDLPGPWLASDMGPLVVHVAAMPLPAAERVVARVLAEAPDAVVTLDTHEDWVADHRNRLLALATRVHVFLPSREELSDLVGYDDPHRAVAEFASLSTPFVIVKLGREGCLVWDRDSGTVQRVGVSPGPVVDVTGAGDGFCGGFAAGLSLGLSPVEAARRGAVSAGFAVADFSSMQLAAVTPEDAEGRLKEAPPPVEPNSVVAHKGQGQATGWQREDPRAIKVMGEEIGAIPDVLADQLASLHPRLIEVATTLAREGVERVILTGCGDSLFAGMASTLAFHRYARVEAEAVHAMELARYRVRYLPEQIAVMCISYSGEVGRTIEAAVQARRFGHRVFALTGRANGRLAREADETVLLRAPVMGFSPGTSTYVAMTAALCDLAVSLGEVLGRETAAARTAMEQVPDLARTTLSKSFEPALRIAARLVGQTWVAFIGAGPNEASARFGAAKLFEGPQVLGAWTNLEEWAHEDYFVTTKGTPVIVVAPTGASLDRAREILSELEFLDADAMIVTDAQDLPDGADLLPLAAGLPEELTPILAALPLSLLAFHISELTGKRSYNFRTEDAEREHYETIHRDTRGEPA
jgi:ribokinase